jgi:hypothetical protein
MIRLRATSQLIQTRMEFEVLVQVLLLIHLQKSLSLWKYFQRLLLQQIAMCSVRQQFSVVVV